MKWIINFVFLLLAAIEARAALPHQVYVWQRAWTEPVRESVAAHATNFTEAAVLLAEVSWRDGLPQVTRANVDYLALAKTHCPVGLVLRIGPYKGALEEDKLTVNFVSELAATLIADAQKKQIQPVELQIDFDCATSQLDDYRAWLAVVQRRVAPVPVTITALPSWLDAPAFARLAAAATNYVLQVHSLEKPARLDAPFSLCDPVVARRAVARAGELGVPFRVALPTYTYLVAFDAKGKFIGIAAETPRAGWPAETQLRELSADPLAMDKLVRFWNTNSPPGLRGVIWYRLPVAVDNFNWRWPTLCAIVSAHELREKFHAEVRRVDLGLVEISLVNDGEIDISSRLAIEARWSDARLVAGDGLRGFEMAEQSASAAKLINQPTSFRLRAGDKMVAGWLRFDQDREVQLEVNKF